MPDQSTAMTDVEWEDITAVLRRGWPGEFTQRDAEVYRMFVGNHSAEAVTRAIFRAAERNPTYRPAAAEIAAALRGLGRSHPSPDEAWALIARAVHKVAVSVYDPRFPELHQAAIDWLAGQDRVVAAFAASRGLAGRSGSFALLQVDDPDRGGVVLATVKKDYQLRLEVARDREVRGLAAVEDRELLVRATGQRAAFADGSEQRALDGGGRGASGA